MMPIGNSLPVISRPCLVWIGHDHVHVTPSASSASRPVTERPACSLRDACIMTPPSDAASSMTASQPHLKEDRKKDIARMV